MTTLREAAQQALETLEALSAAENIIWVQKRAEIEVEHLRAVLAQEDEPKGGGNLPPPLQAEPVAFADRISFDQAMKSGKGHDVWPEAGDYEARTGRKLRVLYTHPPRREWQSLSEEEIWNDDKIMAENAHCNLMLCDLVALSRAIETKLKEKNNG